MRLSLNKFLRISLFLGKIALYPPVVWHVLKVPIRGLKVITKPT